MVNKATKTKNMKIVEKNFSNTMFENTNTDYTTEIFTSKTPSNNIRTHKIVTKCVFFHGSKISDIGQTLKKSSK